MSKKNDNIEVLHIGDLAKRVGKSVRAIHHYEELGLLEPKRRSKGGFREYDKSALAKIQWILKLQTIGFSLTEIKGLVEEFSNQKNGPKATYFAHSVFVDRLHKVRETISELRATEAELKDAIDYLGECNPCEKDQAPADCHGCNNFGHSPENVPHLFSGLTHSVVSQSSTGKASSGNSSLETNPLEMNKAVGIENNKLPSLELDATKRKSL